LSSEHDQTDTEEASRLITEAVSVKYSSWPILTRSEPVPQWYTDFVHGSCMLPAKAAAKPGLDAKHSIAKSRREIVPESLAYDLEQTALTLKSFFFSGAFEPQR
jgi:hypothetical protein